MNLEDIARLAGVSRSTVSRVINDDPRVSDAVRARVKGVIAEHDYHPNAAARTLASRRSSVIGLFIPVSASSIFSDPWFPIMIQGCMDGCQEQNLSLMLLMESETDPDAADRLILRSLRSRHLDGVVVATSNVDEPIFTLLSQHHIPYVVIGRVPDGDASWVDIDNAGAACDATTHLLSHGRRRAAMIAGPRSLVASLDRAEGFRRACEAAGVPATVIHTEFDQRHALAVALQLLDGPDPPDAIFTASDVIALGVLQAARLRHIDIPRSLGVMGFDDIQPDRIAPSGLSSVRQPARELGRQAVLMLNERIASPEAPPRHARLPTALVLRSSCGCQPERETAEPLPDRQRKEDRTPATIEA